MTGRLRLLSLLTGVNQEAINRLMNKRISQPIG